MSLAAALQAWTASRSPAAAARVHAELLGAQVLVAVAATGAGRHASELTGLPVETTTEMGLVTLRAPSGATAIPAFSQPDALAAWADRTGEAVRPVRVEGRRACAAAVAEGHAAVVLDVGGPAFAIDGADLQALAAGFVPVAGDPRLSARQVAEAPAVRSPAAVPAGLVRAVRAAVAAEPGVVEAWLVDLVLPGEPPTPAVGLVPATDGADLPAVADRLARALGPLLGGAGLDVLALTGAALAAARSVGVPAHAASHPAAPS